MSASGIPVDSPQVRAARGIITAVRNSEPAGVNFSDAVTVHTAGMDRAQLIDVAALLAGALFLVRDALDDTAREIGGE